MPNNSTFLSREQALDTAAELTAMIGSDFELPDIWHETWMPIFSNGSGDFICYDLAGSFDGQPGQLIEYWHADNDRNIIAGDLTSFLGALVDLYTMYDPSDEFVQVEDLPGYPVRHIVQ
ncbi:SMI1/KNR4 family protein [Chitinophaga sp.]|uniref:SMI1/KNR4 family protein n=1 Tax=Chitinophaga sp. TaxID=1869181 RepID=UPI0031D4F4FA